MIIGVPKETKDQEFRVALTPAGTRALLKAGHRVVVEAGAGTGSGLDDAQYTQAGAEIVSEKALVFDRADLIVKVKEPLPAEYALLKKGQALFTYLHLAADRRLTETLLEREIFAIAYETVESADGSRPILRPMSEVAGRLAVQIGAHYLERVHGGRGVLLGGVPGVPNGKVVIIGAGVVGTEATHIAVGFGARVVVAVLHYAVPNMPGIVPETSTFALTNASFPFILRLAELGPEHAVRSDPALAKGLNLAFGRITHRAVAEAFGMTYAPGVGA